MKKKKLPPMPKKRAKIFRGFALSDRTNRQITILAIWRGMTRSELIHVLIESEFERERVRGT